MSSEVIDWLLTGPSWLQYAVKLQLLHSDYSIISVVKMGYTTDQRLKRYLDLILLSHWEMKTDNWRPYGFGVGSQFKKLKYPAIK